MLKIDLPIARISALDPEFRGQLTTYLKREMLASDEILQQVRNILQDVRINGDRAIVDYTNKLDSIFYK